MGHGSDKQVIPLWVRWSLPYGHGVGNIDSAKKALPGMRVYAADVLNLFVLAHQLHGLIILDQRRHKILKNVTIALGYFKTLLALLHSHRRPVVATATPPSQVGDLPRLKAAHHFLDLRLPVQGKGIVYIASRYILRKRYKVNLSRLTCSCRRFKSMGKRYAEGDTNGLCRHLAKALLQEGGIPDALIKIILLERELPVCFEFLQGGIVVGSVPESPWRDVYVPCTCSKQGGQSYERYLYNSSQHRWTGQSPTLSLLP